MSLRVAALGFSLGVFGCSSAPPAEAPLPTGSDSPEGGGPPVTAADSADGVTVGCDLGVTCTVVVGVSPEVAQEAREQCSVRGTVVDICPASHVVGICRTARMVGKTMPEILVYAGDSAENTAGRLVGARRSCEQNGGKFERVGG